MALSQIQIQNNFNAMLTDLEMNSPTLTAKEIASSMSDWILMTAAAQYEFCSMDTMPYFWGPQAGKLYISKTGNYKLRDAKGTVYSGTLFDLGATLFDAPDEETKKLQDPDAISKLDSQLETLESSLLDSKFMLNVMKITTKLGHNKVAETIKSACALTIHSDKLKVSTTQNSTFLKTKAAQQDMDFYQTTVFSTLDYQNTNFIFKKLVSFTRNHPLMLAMIVLCLTTVLCGIVIPAPIIATVYLISPSFAMELMLLSAANMAKSLINGTIIIVSTTFCSEKQTDIIGNISQGILSVLFAHQFFASDLLFAGAIQTLDACSAIFPAPVKDEDEDEDFAVDQAKPPATLQPKPEDYPNRPAFILTAFQRAKFAAATPAASEPDLVVDLEAGAGLSPRLSGSNIDADGTD